MAGRWDRFAGIAAASGSALWLHRLLDFSPLRSQWVRESNKDANMTGHPQTSGMSSYTLQNDEDIVMESKPVHRTWKLYAGSKSGLIKRRAEGETGGLHLLSGSAYPEIATEVSGILGVNLIKCQLGTFSDGECSVEITEPVSDGDIFIISPTHTSSSIMELLLMISAVRRVGVKRVTAVIPYFGYARQDVREKREPVAAADVAMMLETVGVDRIIAVDMHSALIEGFFSPATYVDHLSTAQLGAAHFCEKIKKKPKDWQDAGGMGTSPTKRIVVVASQDGHVSRATDFADCLECQLGEEYSVNVALVSRSVEYSDHHQQLYRTVVGDIEGADCILMDDMISTGETMETAVKAIKAAGATSISAFATHGRFCQGGRALVNSIADLDELAICNTVPHQEMNGSETDSGTTKSDLIRVLTVAPLLAEAIFRTHGKIPMRNLLRSDSADPASAIELSDE